MANELHGIYLQQGNIYLQRLDVSWAISISNFILIFLEWTSLVQNYNVYVSRKNFRISFNLPIELDCMNDVLVEQLAENSQMNNEILKEIRKSKILSRLFQRN